MKLLVNEMWPPELALQLRRRGHDVVSVAERAELRGRADPVIFAAAQAEERTIVTENALDYRPLAVQAIQEGDGHWGLILTSNRRFPRHDPRTVGRVISALDELLGGRIEPRNLEHWLP